MGDLNGRIGLLSTHGATRRSRDIIVNHRGKILYDNSLNSGLRIGNGYLSGDHEGSSTFVSESVSGSSVVDFLLFSNSATSLINKFEVLESHHSDHFPIYVQLIGTHCNETVSPAPTHEKKIVLPNDLLAIRKFKRILDIRVEAINTATDINQLGGSLENAIIQTCTKLDMVKKPRKLDMKPKWFDRECNQLKYLMKSALRKFRRNQIPDMTSHFEDNYRNLKSKYCELVREKSAQHDLNTQTRLHNLKSSQSFWSTFNSRNSSAYAQNTIPKLKWFEHYTNVFTVEGEYVPVSIEVPDNDTNLDPILDADINIFEIKMALNRLKPNKAAGKDLIPN